MKADWPDAISQVLIRVSRLEDSSQHDLAEMELARAIKEFPDSFELRSRYAGLLCAFGDWQKSLKQIEVAERLQPSLSIAVTKARCFMGLLRPRDAETALQCEPRNPEALTMLGYLKQSQGRFEEARFDFLESVRLDPGNGGAYHGLGQGKKVTASELPMIERAESVVHAGSLAPAQEMPIYYFLGKAREDLGDFRLAYQHFEQANKLGLKVNHRGFQFDEKAYRAEVDLLISRFGELDGVEPWTGVASKPLFVVGMMRSGTTLVEQILSANSQIYGAGELGFWPDHRTEALNPGSSGRLRSLYGGVLASFGDRTWVIDKTPSNYQLLGPILRAFPEAKVLHVRRDPGDTCLSIFTTAYAVSPDFAHRKDRIAFAYREYLRIMEHWRRILPSSALMEIDYEKLVMDRESVLRSVVEWLGVSWDEKVLRHEDNARQVTTPSAWQVRQSVYSNSIGRWKRFREWIPEFEELEQTVRSDSR